MFSFLRQLTTWHCLYSTAHAAAAARLLLTAGHAAIDRIDIPWLQGQRQQTRSSGRTEQMDGRPTVA